MTRSLSRCTINPLVFNCFTNSSTINTLTCDVLVVLHTYQYLVVSFSSFFSLQTFRKLSSGLHFFFIFSRNACSKEQRMLQGASSGCYCFVAQSCLTLLQAHELQPARLLCPWDFPGVNTGVDCHFLLQGIFPIQGSNSSLLH